MELLLNALWVLLCAVAFANWRCSKSFHSKSFHNRSDVQVLVLTCCLLLLFPVISATDDLSTAQLTSETNAKKISPTVSSEERHAFTTSNHAPWMAWLQAVVIPSPGGSMGSLSKPADFPSFTLQVVRISQDRAPPSA